MNSGRQITFKQALQEALEAAMRLDDRILLLGEDMSLWGGRHRVAEGFAAKFGDARIIDTPLIEDMMVGVASGLALGGYKPIVELAYGVFLSLAIDDIYRASTWRFRYPPAGYTPLVIRVSSGAYDGRGQEFSAHFMSWFQHIPGLTIISPATPFDAKGLLASAIHSGRTVLCFEDKKLYPMVGNVPEETYALPIGASHVLRAGTDATLISCGYVTQLALHAKDKLSEEGIEAEVLDLRTLVPLDIQSIMKSVKKTGRAIILEQGIMRGGIGAEIIARIIENDRNVLVRRLGAPNVPPAPLAWEQFTLPSVEAITAATKDIINSSNR